MRPQGEKTPHNSQRIGAREACSDLQVRFLSRQGPWLALSTGKRNRLASVLSAPHRAICANCRETAIFSSLGSWMPDAALARGICRVAATVPAAKVRRVCPALACRRPAHGTIHPLRICASQFRHWPSALHCCPSLLLCADLQRGTARRAAVALPAGAS